MGAATIVACIWTLPAPVMRLRTDSRWSTRALSWSYSALVTYLSLRNALDENMKRKRGEKRQKRSLGLYLMPLTFI